MPSFRHVARSICRVAYTDGVGSGGTMLTMRFDVDAVHRAATIEALVTRILPSLVSRKGIAGVHLCLADEAVSKIETAEKKARADTTLVPTWIVLIEGIAPPEVHAAGGVVVAAMQSHFSGGSDTGIYRLEFTRLKTLSSAG